MVFPLLETFGQEVRMVDDFRALPRASPALPVEPRTWIRFCFGKGDGPVMVYGEDITHLVAEE